MFKLNLKIAMRNLWKYKGFTLINVGGLAIGLSICMLLLLYVAYELGYDKQFSNYDKTYVVYLNSKTNTGVMSYGFTPGVMAAEIREKIPGVAYSSRASYPQDELISYEQKNFKMAVVYADASFLKIFDYHFLNGNPKKALMNANAVILTRTLAKKLFGNEEPINKVVRIQNSEPMIVEAVIEDIPGNSTIKFDYLATWAMQEKLNPWVKNTNWGNNFCLTVVQLKDNKYYANASKQIQSIYTRNSEGSPNEGYMQPLAKWHLYDKFENGVAVGGKIEQIRIFVALSLCILLIACVNFMNLSTARSERRAKEVGVRKAIGSSRKSLISQFMLESFVLAFLGMLVAFVLLELSLPYFSSIINIGLDINYADPKFWTALVGLALFTGFISGSYPAFYLSSFETVKVLKGFNTAGNNSLSVRKVLVVFQFVFAACLIACTGVVYQQLNFIKNKPIGYDKNGLIEIPLQGNLKDKSKMDLAKERLLKSGAATAVTYFSQNLSSGGNTTYDFSWPGKIEKDQILMHTRGAGDDFSETLGANLVAGREFSAAFVDTVNVMVNEAAVKTMGLKQPLGAVIKWDETPVTIIGVIKDFVVESPFQHIEPMVIYHPTTNYSTMLVRLNPAQNISSSVRQIDDIIKNMNPDFPVDRRFVSDGFKDKLQTEQLLGILANWFGGFAIFISCLGLLGLALFMAEQRRKEISIRKILGASTTNILVLLNRDFIKLVAIANVIALPLAYIIMNHWLSSYSFRISITAIPFVIAFGISFLVALLTVSVQSLKVTKANPVAALKYE